MLLRLADDDFRPAGFVGIASFGPCLAEVEVVAKDETDVADYGVGF